MLSEPVLSLVPLCRAAETLCLEHLLRALILISTFPVTGVHLSVLRTHAVFFQQFVTFPGVSQVTEHSLSHVTHWVPGTQEEKGHFHGLLRY